MNISDNIITIKGIGEKTAQAFNKLQIYTIKDLLFHFPRRYVTYPTPSALNDDAVGDVIAFTGKKLISAFLIRNIKSLSATIL